MSTPTTDSKLTALADLMKLLPTGTFFLFMSLDAVLSNDGNCGPIDRWLTVSLIASCGVVCVVSCFTDSHREGNITQYGIVTITGRLWPCTVKSKDYKLKIADFVHAFLSLIVLGVLVFPYPNTVNCLCPSLETKWFQKWLPLLVGFVSFVAPYFPQTRHGIGYHNNSNPEPSQRNTNGC